MLVPVVVLLLIHLPADTGVLEALPRTSVQRYGVGATLLMIGRPAYRRVDRTGSSTSAGLGQVGPNTEQK